MSAIDWVSLLSRVVDLTKTLCLRDCDNNCFVGCNVTRDQWSQPGTAHYESPNGEYVERRRGLCILSFF